MKNSFDSQPWLMPFIVLLMIGFCLFGPGGRDDAHISYWAAQSLADTGEILNINGRRVEQGSSLLHVLVLALTQKISGLPMAYTGLLVSLAAACITLRKSHALAGLTGLRHPTLYLYALCFSAPFTYWALGGLETLLVAAALVYLCYNLSIALRDGTQASIIKTAIAAALYLLLRPEAPFVLALFLALLALGLYRYGSLAAHRKTLTRVFAFAVLFCSAVLLFRYIYFDALFPQPVSAKSRGIEFSNITDGILSLLGLVYFPSILVMIGSVFLLGNNYLKGRDQGAIAALPIVSMAIACLGFTVASGGDWMEGYRFLAPILPLALVAAFLCLEKSASGSFKAICILMLCMLTESLLFAGRASTGIPLWASQPKGLLVNTLDADAEKYLQTIDTFPLPERYNLVHLRDIHTLAPLSALVSNIRAHDQRPITIMSMQMGLIPYYLVLQQWQGIEIIDMRGLATRHFSDCSITASRPRLSTGIKFGYPDFFALAAKLQSQCNIAKPDIIYDLKPVYYGTVVAANGYRIVFEQSGKLFAPLGFNAIRAGQFIALREDLAVSLESAGLLPQEPEKLQFF